MAKQVQGSVLENKEKDRLRIVVRSFSRFIWLSSFGYTILQHRFNQDFMFYLAGFLFVEQSPRTLSMLQILIQNLLTRLKVLYRLGVEALVNDVFR